MSFSEYIKVFFLFVLLPCIIIIPTISSIVFNTRKLISKQFNTEKRKNIYNHKNYNINIHNHYFNNYRFNY